VGVVAPTKKLDEIVVATEHLPEFGPDSLLAARLDPEVAIEAHLLGHVEQFLDTLGSNSVKHRRAVVGSVWCVRTTLHHATSPW